MLAFNGIFPYTVLWKSTRNSVTFCSVIYLLLVDVHSTFLVNLFYIPLVNVIKTIIAYIE